MTQEVLKQALEALEYAVMSAGGETGCDHHKNICFCLENKAITALRTAISQPDCRGCKRFVYCENRFDDEPLYENCTNGDRFVALPIVKLYKVAP